MIYLDSTTCKPAFDRPFGHFVRVLVDIVLHKDLSYKILVERVGFAFFIEIEYEKLSDFCQHYNLTGHSLGVFRRRN